MLTDFMLKQWLPQRTSIFRYTLIAYLVLRRFVEDAWSIIVLKAPNVFASINPLNAELNPIRHLLALVGARHVVHVSRIRVKSHPPFASIGRSSPYCPR